eukprot:6497492-Pyramimonas_sp.AAC.1
MASGPRETTAGLGIRGVAHSMHRISTAPPNEAASARKAKEGANPATRVLRGVYPPLTGPGCAPPKRFGTPGRPTRHHR